MSARHTPTVSVVIPVYNRPVAVRRAIESVLSQTYQNFEIIVVDDGSTEDVAAAVASIHDHRVALIRLDRNRGGSAARNAGIRASSGAFVAFLDSDDEWLPKKLERQLDLFGRCDERLAVVYTGSHQVFSDGSVATGIPRRYDDLARALLSLNVIGGTSVGMVRRDALDVVGGFDERLPACQDLDLWLRLCERFAADFVPEALVTVMMTNDRGRITVNPASTTKGRELFCAKHRAKMARQGVLHKYLRTTGWLYQREGRDARLARRCYLQSLTVQPIAPLTYVLLLAACLPMSWLDEIARWRRVGRAVLFRT